jgi:hypothetical protein
MRPSAARPKAIRALYHLLKSLALAAQRGDWQDQAMTMIRLRQRAYDDCLGTNSRSQALGLWHSVSMQQVRLDRDLSLRQLALLLDDLPRCRRRIPFAGLRRPSLEVTKPVITRALDTHRIARIS